MMVVITLLRETGFFSRLGIKMIKLAKYEPRSIMISLLITSSVMTVCVDAETCTFYDSTSI